MTHEISDGSVKTLWRVSLPLILSFLSLLGMVTVDRLFLAGYSTAALGAAASAGTTAWAFTFGGQTLTNIAGVFVARHNGAGRFGQIGRPVWQMVWLSLFFSLPFAAAAVWLAPLFFAGSPIEQDQILYFRWTMAISPLTCLVGALNGFFAGQGRTRVITYFTLLGNLINFVLDPILIFGWGGIPSYGIAGACAATWLGMATQVTALFILFLRRDARQKYDTGNYSLDWTVLRACVRVGGPEALAATLELGAWGTFYILLSNLGVTYILVTSVAQSILMATFWFGIGMEQGISSVAGNLMGQKKLSEVYRCFNSGLKIIGLFGLMLISFLTLCKGWIVNLFLANPETAEVFSTLTAEQLLDARTHLLQSLFVIGVYIVIESVRCILYGVLRAAGDTVFILVLSVASIWLLLLLPTYQLMSVWKLPVNASFWIWLTYASFTTATCYLRFYKGSWNRKQLFA